MLPDKIHPGDVKWFREQIIRIPVHHRMIARDAYSDVWKSAHDAEPLLHCKENSGRFAANTRLRKYIERVLSR